MIKSLRIWLCDMFHWGAEKAVIAFYSNGSHKYYCKKCKHEYEE